MNKKALVLALLLLAIPILAVIPVQAKANKVPYTEIASTSVLLGIEKMWLKGDIMHAKGIHLMYTDIVCTLGTGTLEGWIDQTINLKTGEGRAIAKWVMTLTGTYGSGTLEGTTIFKGRVVDWVNGFPVTESTGIAIGSRGTGDFEGVKLLSKVTISSTGVATAVGTLTFHD